MNTNNPNPEDARLSSLLRESRVAPRLPPRFQENVWRRIADVEDGKSLEAPSWFDAFIGAFLRPRLAVAAVVALVMAAVLLGWQQGNQLARRDSQARYLAAVAPNSLR